MLVNMDRDGNIEARASGSEAIRAQVLVLDAHIRSQTKIRLSLFLLAGFFLIAAAFLVVFAPSGRETLTIIVCVALVAIAFGCAGFSAFAIKTPGLSVRGGGNVRHGRRRRNV